MLRCERTIVLSAYDILTIKMLDAWITLTFCLIITATSQDIDRGLIVSLLPDHVSTGEIATFPGRTDSFVNSKDKKSDKRYFYFFENTNVLSMACDPRNKTIYILDGVSRSLYKMEEFNIWLNNTQRNVSLLHRGISHSSGSQIAFDWLTRNIYWTDELYNWIGVQPVDTTDRGMYRIILHEGLSSPIALAVDPIKGYLFFAEHGISTVIERTDLAGRNRQTILTSVSKVPDMVLDTEEERIYWIDIGRNGIETAKYDGSDRRLVRRSTNIYIYMSGVTLYKDVVCLTKYQEMEVLCLDKRNGAIKWSNSFGFQQPWAVEVYDQDVQKLVPHACQNFGCQHMCANTPTGAKCMCKEGFELDTDGKACKAEHNLYPKGLLLVNGTDLCMLDVRVITLHVNDVLCFLRWKHNITYLAVDANRKNIYFTDSASQRVMRYNVELNVTDAIATTASVSGIVYDWIGGDILWSETDTGKIQVTTASDDSRQASTIYSGLSKPSHLTINPHNHTLFWISLTNGQYSIEGGTIDGTTRWTVAKGAILKQPSGLFFDITYNKLFYIDSGELTSIRSDGGGIHTFNSVGSDTSILVYKDYVLTTRGKDKITTINVHTKTQNTVINITDFGHVSSFSVFDKSVQMGERSPCMYRNGGCQHICVLSKTGRQCRCGFGYTLSPDGVSCTSTPMMGTFALTVDYTHGILYQIALDKEEIKAIDLPNPNFPISAVYDSKNHHVYWADFARYQILQSTVWGKNKSVVFNTGTFIPSALQIDPSTGNIYYACSMFDYNAGLTSHIAVLRPRSGQNKVVISQLEVVKNLAIHPKRGWLYWIDKGASTYSAYIGKGAMDGDNRSFFVSSNLYSPSGLALDYEGDKLYWADSYLNTINYIGLDGSGRGELTHDPRADIMQLAIYGPNLYYTAVNRQFISKVNKITGTISTWMKKIPEFGRLESIDIHPGDAMPVHKKCARNNGLCSTFCLPTPFGRTCGCEDGVQMQSDGRTCEGVRKCNDTIPNGGLNADCSSYLGTTCTFYCNQGYRSITYKRNLHCDSNGRWGVKVETLCERIQNTNTGRQFDTHTLDNKALGGIMGGVIAVLLIVFIVIFIIFYRRRSGMFAHAKFVNSPNVQLDPSNAERFDIKDSHNKSKDIKNGTIGTDNPLYESQNVTNSSNNHVYSTLDAPKV